MVVERAGVVRLEGKGRLLRLTRLLPQAKTLGTDSKKMVCFGLIRCQLDRSTRFGHALPWPDESREGQRQASMRVPGERVERDRRPCGLFRLPETPQAKQGFTGHCVGQTGLG